MGIKLIGNEVHSSTPRIACWRILYRGEELETFRTVHVLKVRPRLEQIEAFCELRRAMRTFSLRYIIKAYDLDRLAPVDIAAWLAAYKASRRADPARRPRNDD